MMSLAGKKIVLGVSGGIAAYKAPELVRRLRERGAPKRRHFQLQQSNLHRFKYNR